MEFFVAVDHAGGVTDVLVLFLDFQLSCGAIIVQVVALGKSKRHFINLSDGCLKLKGSGAISSSSAAKR
jgi:hypothetical protein